ncbi:MarR family winged helix-turn-helix transcriptional regulator [Phenylobacterium sp.]|uniref:MarR family winged helix-turn-helix transcriptional regulator n=1 Tax=Phenylobacterium sp. TaxID=1871053 RepID=UPI002FC6C4BC
MADHDSGTFREKHDGLLSGGLDVRLWLRLLSCSTIVEKRLRRRLADEFDTTLPRFDVLAALERRPDGMSMGELSTALLVSNGNLTVLVRQLQAQGLATLRPAPTDRRSQVVALTPAGAEQFATFARAHHQWVSGMFAGMPVEKREQLFDLLAIMKRSIAAEDRQTSPRQ